MIFEGFTEGSGGFVFGDLQCMMGALLTPPRICGVEGDSGDSRAEARDVRPTHGHCAPPVHQG